MERGHLAHKPAAASIRAAVCCGFSGPRSWQGATVGGTSTSRLGSGQSRPGAGSRLSSRDISPCVPEVTQCSARGGALRRERNSGQTLLSGSFLDAHVIHTDARPTGSCTPNSTPLPQPWNTLCPISAPFLTYCSNQKTRSLHALAPHPRPAVPLSQEFKPSLHLHPQRPSLVPATSSTHAFLHVSCQLHTSAHPSPRATARSKYKLHCSSALLSLPATQSQEQMR